jgi:hypothetical protein
MNAEFFALAFIAALNPKLLALDLLRRQPVLRIRSRNHPARVVPAASVRAQIRP